MPIIISNKLDMRYFLMTHKEHAKVFKAFSDERRLHILELLRAGEKCACELLEDLDIGQSTLSYQMKILVESGVVQSRQDGKWTHYQISNEGSIFASKLVEELTSFDKTRIEN